MTTLAKALPAETTEVERIVRKCLSVECARNLADRSLEELDRHFSSFLRFCADRGVDRVASITSPLIFDFVQQQAARGHVSLTKAVVWSMRKLGSYLALVQHLPDNPAKALQHPKISRRAKLPEYLRPGELHALLQTAVQTRCLRDVTVLSLLATAGLRPREIALLRRDDVDIGQQVIYVHVKGNWRKRTPLSAPMADTLEDYLAQYPDTGPRLFLNNWGRPLDQRWVLRLTRTAARQAGIRRTITPRILRHTFATYLADRHGKQLTRAMLGHSFGASTDVYMHLIPSAFRRYMNLHPYQTVVRRKP